MTLRVVLFAPTPSSLYSRVLAELIQREAGLELMGVVVRSMWSWTRLRGELRRDGARLVRKAYNKLLLGEQAYPTDELETLPRMAAEIGLSAENLPGMARRLSFRLLRSPDLNSPRVVDFLESLHTDVVVFSGGGLIREAVLDVPKEGILNCHSGILPPYRGMDVVEWVILEAENAPALGLTLHFMDRGVDTGPILLHHHEHLRPGDTLDRIRRRLEPEMVKLMMNGLRGLRDGDLNAQAQAREAGRQYFVMHPRLKLAAEEKVIRLAAESRTRGA
jgi:methionyl-tRNA formyltransferase